VPCQDSEPELERDKKRSAFSWARRNEIFVPQGRDDVGMPLFRPRRVVEEGPFRHEEFGRVAWLVRTGGFSQPLPSPWWRAGLVGGGVAAGTLLRSLSSLGLGAAIPAGIAGVWLTALAVDRLARRRQRPPGGPPGGPDPSGDRTPRPEAPLAGAGAAARPLPRDDEPE
jgi:hypothetical protein